MTLNAIKPVHAFHTTDSFLNYMYMHFLEPLPDGTIKSHAREISSTYLEQRLGWRVDS